MESVTAAGGVVFRQSDTDSVEVVLIYRRGVWDLPKGKLEADESIEECARREVAEELGLAGTPKIVGDLPVTYHEFNRNGIHYGKKTYWYKMEISSNEILSPQQEEDIEQAEWIPLTKAHKKIAYENLKKVLRGFEDSLKRD